VEEASANLDPLLATHLVALPEQLVVFFRKRQMVNVWIQVIHPAITNLLADTAGETLGQVRPASKGLLRRSGDGLHDNGIFVIGPLTLADTWLQVANPALVAFLGTIVERGKKGGC
jgi:hypothetical protein